MFVQIAKLPLALIKLAQVALQRRSSLVSDRSKKSISPKEQTFSSAIRAWISYTVQVKSFLIRCTCKDRSEGKFSFYSTRGGTVGSRLDLVACS